MNYSPRSAPDPTPVGRQVQSGSATTATTPSVALAESLSSNSLQMPPPGYRDFFLEQRFKVVGPLDLDVLASENKIAFLSKARQLDELYDVAPNSGLEAGLYRIRDEGAPAPLVTRKSYGNGSSIFSETIDVIDPEPNLLNDIRSQGKLVAVIEKTRVTYKSKSFPDCLLHRDSVSGLGEFYDLKADSEQSMQSWVDSLGLSDQHRIHDSYYQMKLAAGVSSLQLGVWKFHQRFEDYVLGVVSGTLTPLGFLTATAATGASTEMMIVSLAVAGIGDGISDAVAASQTVQSKSGATFQEQFGLFARTMAGKAIIPMTFLPTVLFCPSSYSIIGVAAGWSVLLLSTTAAIQAVAHQRSVLPAVGKLVAFGGLASLAGLAIGELVPRIWAAIGL